MILLEASTEALKMKSVLVALVILLSLLVGLLAEAVVRLENYRYANFIGFCNEYTVTSPMQRIKREECLENTQTRPHWSWHILYGLKFL